MSKIFLKKQVFLLIIIVFDLIIGLRTAIGFFYFFFWFLITAVVISFVWLIIEYLGLRLHLTRKIVSRVVEDDTLEIEAVIKNKGILPIFNFVLEDYLSCATHQERHKWILLDYLGIKNSVSLKYSCLCPQRGRYKTGPFVVYLLDPFSLFFLKKTYYVYSELYVYPKTFNIQTFPPLLKGIQPWFGIETARISGDEDEFFGIREYEIGDPKKRIHWMSTARKNMLIVKEFQRQSFFRATIIFNLEEDKNYGQGKETVSEYTIKIAASVAKYLIERNISLEIIAHVGEIVHIPFNKGSGHLEDIFKFLAVAQARSEVNLGEIFEEFSRYIPDDSNLVVIMIDQDWENLPVILSLQARNISLIPFVLISHTFFLYPSDKDSIIKQIKTKLPKSLIFNPKFFSCGDNLEEIFSY